MVDEDETVEVTRFGDACPRLMPIGLDYAEARARARYVDGVIEIDEFEAEIGRLLAKRDALR